MRLLFSSRAVLDLEEIGDYIARDNPTRARSFIDEVAKHCDRIASTPSAFVARDDLAPGVHMAVHGNYLIFFREVDRSVRIERIIHGARRVVHLL